jgi:hypothetical protein
MATFYFNGEEYELSLKVYWGKTTEKKHQLFFHGLGKDIYINIYVDCGFFSGLPQLIGNHQFTKNSLVCSKVIIKENPYELENAIFSITTDNSGEYFIEIEAVIYEEYDEDPRLNVKLNFKGLVLS